MASLHPTRLLRTGNALHQAAPVALAAPPAPVVAEAVQAELAAAGGGPGEHRLAPQAGGNPLAEPLAAGAMAPQQRDGEASVWIHHHHSGILVFVAQQRCDQPGHQAAGRHHHEGLGVPPLLLQAEAGAGLVIGAQPLIDQAGLGQALQHWPAGGAESQTPDRGRRLKLRS